MMYFASNLWATKSFARASSNSSLADGFESRKSSTGSTMPRPFRWNQMRLTTDLGKKGLSPLVSQSASTSRRSLPGAVAVDDLGARQLRSGARLQDVLLLLHPGEEGGHAVVVVLGPALERVIVTLGALHPNAEEQLGGR